MTSYQDVANRFEVVIKNEMPPSAESNSILVEHGLKIRFSWLLNNDPLRPNKRSKNIIVKVSREVIEDFIGLPLHVQEKVLLKAAGYINNQMQYLDADHETPAELAIPVEYWNIPSEYLFG